MRTGRSAGIVSFNEGGSSQIGSRIPISAEQSARPVFPSMTAKSATCTLPTLDPDQAAVAANGRKVRTADLGVVPQTVVFEA